VVERGAYEFANRLKNKYGNYIDGPAEPLIGRVRNQYLMEMLFKIPRDGRILAQCKKDIAEQVAIIHQEKSFRSMVIVTDVDSQ
jgi:primosomal protein N' (replication factor Y)